LQSHIFLYLNQTFGQLPIKIESKTCSGEINQ